MDRRLNLSMSYLHDRSILSNPGWNENKFDPIDYARPELSENEIEVFKEIFDCFDSLRSGTLSPFDLRKAFLNCGYRIPRKLVYQIISDFDGDESGGIEFNEFLDMMLMTPCQKDSDDEIKRVFEKIAGRKGFIEKKDLKIIVEEMNEDFKTDKEKEDYLTTEALEEIFDYFLEEEKGVHNDKISWEQFLTFNKEYMKFVK